MDRIARLSTRKFPIGNSSCQFVLIIEQIDSLLLDLTYGQPWQITL